MIVEGVTPQWH